MYNKNYYPTPSALIDKMLEPYKPELKKWHILEPSAGMGAICDALKWKGAKATNIYCCEIDPEFQATLTGKGYKAIHSDFLSYSGSMLFNLIVMNPPFDRGAEHLLKAWEVLRHGHIVCLLNAETLNNPHTEARKHVVEVIRKNGTVESLGNAFADAARGTDVDVVMVRLEKKSSESGISFDGMQASTQPSDFNLESDQSAVAKNNYIGALIRAYEKATMTTELMYKAMAEFQLYAGSFLGQYDTDKAVTAFFNTSMKMGYVEAHNEFIQTLQRKAWAQVFNNTNMSGQMTEKVREKFEKWRTDMGGMDLNAHNINFLFEALIQQKDMISEDCITEAFNSITMYSPKNRDARVSWKTNSAYMVADKFILSNIVNSDWGSIRLNYRSRGLLDDIDRALCIINGSNFTKIAKTAQSIENWCSDQIGAPEESEFFTFKAYLKGSVHFKFKDNSLRDSFNRVACAKKGWQLPEEELFHNKSRRK